MKKLTAIFLGFLTAVVPLYAADKEITNLLVPYAYYLQLLKTPQDKILAVVAHENQRIRAILKVQNATDIPWVCASLGKHLQSAKKKVSEQLNKTNDELDQLKCEARGHNFAILTKIKDSFTREYMPLSEYAIEKAHAWGEAPICGYTITVNDPQDFVIDNAVRNQQFIQKVVDIFSTGEHKDKNVLIRINGKTTEGNDLPYCFDLALCNGLLVYYEKHRIGQLQELYNADRIQAMNRINLQNNQDPDALTNLQPESPLIRYYLSGHCDDKIEINKINNMIVPHVYYNKDLMVSNGLPPKGPKREPVYFSEPAAEPVSWYWYPFSWLTRGRRLEKKAVQPQETVEKNYSEAMNADKSGELYRYQVVKNRIYQAVGDQAAGVLKNKTQYSDLHAAYDAYCFALLSFEHQQTQNVISAVNNIGKVKGIGGCGEEMFAQFIEAKKQKKLDEFCKKLPYNVSVKTSSLHNLSVLSTNAIQKQQASDLLACKKMYNAYENLIIAARDFYAEIEKHEEIKKLPIVRDYKAVLCTQVPNFSQKICEKIEKALQS